MREKSVVKEISPVCQVNYAATWRVLRRIARGLLHENPDIIADRSDSPLDMDWSVYNITMTHVSQAHREGGDEATNTPGKRTVSEIHGRTSPRAGAGDGRTVSRVRILRLAGLGSGAIRNVAATSGGWKIGVRDRSFFRCQSADVLPNRCSLRKTRPVRTGPAEERSQGPPQVFTEDPGLCAIPSFRGPRNDLERGCRESRGGVWDSPASTHSGAKVRQPEKKTLIGREVFLRRDLDPLPITRRYELLRSSVMRNQERILPENEVDLFRLHGMPGWLEFIGSLGHFRLDARPTHQERPASGQLGAAPMPLRGSVWSEEAVGVYSTMVLQCMGG